MNPVITEEDFEALSPEQAEQTHRPGFPPARTIHMKQPIAHAIRNARRARLSRCPKQSRRLQVEALRALGLGKVSL